MDWKEYENKVLEYFRIKYPQARFSQNIKLPGRLSDTAREIDILIESHILGHSIQIAIECKNWKSKLDVADIGSFIDKIKDVGITKGLMISQQGYSSAAHKRARKELEVQLQVLKFDELPEYYGFWGIPYRGDVGAIISAPNGWIVNNNISQEELPDLLCLLHPYEFTWEVACTRKELMYFSIYPIVDDYNLKKCFHFQDVEVKKKDPDSQIEYWEENTLKGKVTYRKIQYIKDNYVEFTAGVEADTFFVYCVCAVPKNYIPDDLARLRYVIEEMILIKILGIDPTNSDEYWYRFSQRPSNG